MMPEPIDVCLVGAGRAGQVHANSLMRHVPGGALTALVDQSPEALRRAGEMNAIDACYSTLQAAPGEVSFRRCHYHDSDVYSRGID